MGTFGGSFVKWREDMGLQAFPKYINTWVEIINLPMHLWDAKFLQILLNDVGEFITASGDVILKSKARHCKVMLKVQDISEIPRSIISRYESSNDGNIVEGKVELAVVGRSLDEKKGDVPEYYKDFINKEAVSQPSGSADSSTSGRHINGNSRHQGKKGNCIFL